MGRFWTFRYTLLNAAYFVAFCTIHAMAAVYLLANGFNNTEVGILLAVANILSAVAQPVFAGIIDKPGALTNRRFIIISVLIILAGSVILTVSDENKPVIFIFYTIIYMVQFAYQPVMTALCFEYEKAGCNIYYGLARGLGSASFAVTAFFVGGIVEDMGVKILLIINIVAMVISAVIAYTFKLPATADRKNRISGDHPDDDRLLEKTAYVTSEPESISQEKAHNNFFDFIKTYPAYAWFLVATICFFFAHNMINDFMIQIIRALGGGETELGYANFLQAILELPIMALIGIILKKITSNTLLIVSGVAFFIKILILIFAANMVMMYISQSFQMFAYAVFIPAAAYYVSENMAELDQVKGQAFITSAITIGGVFSNLISGWILDNLGITIMLTVGTVICGIGVVIAGFSMQKKVTIHG